MTPDIQKIIDDMQNQINVLSKRLNDFENAPELSPAIKRTLSMVLATSSGKSASSENQAVNEGGAASYSVLKPPDRFIKIGDQNIPAYDA